MTFPSSKELSCASPSKAVFHERIRGTLFKDVGSHVTIADSGVRTLMIVATSKSFPDDEIVGEEEASALRENEKVRPQIWKLVEGVRLEDAGAEETPGAT
ncbi:MAG: hypothetical protein M1832_000985 [Thelocarpon impressellum]|nr:MAG: hypothetical protein M1832_000985 [Thelocarpon impressellum]